jgi:hypothetical protein
MFSVTQLGHHSDHTSIHGERHVKHLSGIGHGCRQLDGLVVLDLDIPMHLVIPALITPPLANEVRQQNHMVLILDHVLDLGLLDTLAIDDHKVACWQPPVKTPVLAVQLLCKLSEALHCAK